MNNELLERAYELNRAGTPFAFATVVRVEKPTSAKPGANAIITSDGTLTGWVGGSCTEHTVLSQARKAMRDGQPRLVRMCPPEKLGAGSQEGVIEVALTCVSGGTLEVFIEPHLPRPHLIVIGHLPVAFALARQGDDLGYDISLMGPDLSPDRVSGADHVQIFNTLDFSQLMMTPQTFVVVASHGNYDEEALTWAVMSDAPYVAMVSSHKRAESVVQYLRESGVPAERLARLKYPAGLDIGAVTPEEIALSIYAEILQFRRRREQAGARTQSAEAMSATEQPEEAEQLEAIDPVCGMTVDIATARHKSEYMGQMYYFCAPGCKRSFDKDPGRYLAVSHGSDH
jgi:xanthine dehydrogenase accessory factor